MEDGVALPPSPRATRTDFTKMGTEGQQKTITTDRWIAAETQIAKFQRRHRAGWLCVSVFHSCRSCSKERFIALSLDGKVILVLSKEVETQKCSHISS